MTSSTHHLDSPKQQLEVDRHVEQDLHENELSSWKSPLGRKGRGVSSISKSDHGPASLEINLGTGVIQSKSTIKGRPHRRRVRNGQTRRSNSTCEEEGDSEMKLRSRASLVSSVTPRGLMLAEMRSKSKRRLLENDEVSTVSSGQQHPRTKSSTGSEKTAPTDDEEESSDINDDEDEIHLPTPGRTIPRSRTAPSRTKSGGAGRSSRRAAAAERLLVEPPKGVAASNASNSVDASGNSSLRRIQSTRRSGTTSELQPSDGQRPANGGTASSSATRRMRSNSVGRKASTRRPPPRTKSLDENLEIANSQSKKSSGIHRSGHSTSGRSTSGRSSRGRKTSSSSQHGKRSSSKSRSRSRSHSRSRRPRRGRRHPLASSTGEKGNVGSDEKRRDDEQHRRQSDKHLEEDSDIGSSEFQEQPPDAIDHSKDLGTHDNKNNSSPSSPKPPRSPKEYQQRSAASLEVEKPSSMEFLRPSSVASSLGTSRSSEEDEISLGNDVEGDGGTAETTEKQTITDMFNKSASAFFGAANKSMARLKGGRRPNQRQRNQASNDVVPSTPVAALRSFLTLEKAPPDAHAQLDDGEESLVLSVLGTGDKPDLKRRSSFEGLEGEKRASLESFLGEDDKAFQINMNKSLPSLMAPSLTASPVRKESSDSPKKSLHENLKKTSLKNSSPVQDGDNSDPLGCIPEDSTRNGNYHTGNLEDLLFMSDDKGPNKQNQMHMSMNDLSRFTPLKQPSIRGFDANHNSPAPKSPVSPSETPSDWRPTETKEPTPQRGDGLSKKRAVSMRTNLTGSSTPNTPSGHVKSTLDFFRRTPSRAKSSDGPRLGRSRTAPSQTSVGDGSESSMDEQPSPAKLFKNGRPPPSSSANGEKSQPRRTKSGEGMLSMLRPDRIARSLSGEGLRAMSPAATRVRSSPRGSGAAIPPSPLIVGEDASSRKTSRSQPPMGKPPRSKSTTGDAAVSPKSSAPKVGSSSMKSPETNPAHQLQGGLVSLAAASPLPGKAGPTRILPVTMASLHPMANQGDDDSDHSSNYDEEASPTLNNATEYLQLAFDGPAIPFAAEQAPKDEVEASLNPKLPPKPPIHQ